MSDQPFDDYWQALRAEWMDAARVEAREICDEFVAWLHGPSRLTFQHVFLPGEPDAFRAGVLSGLSEFAPQYDEDMGGTLAQWLMWGCDQPREMFDRVAHTPGPRRDALYQALGQRAAKSKLLVAAAWLGIRPGCRVKLLLSDFVWSLPLDDAGERCHVAVKIGVSVRTGETT